MMHPAVPPPPDSLSEDAYMAVNRAAQLAKLVPVAVGRRDADLLRLARELCGDLDCALKNLN